MVVEGFSGGVEGVGGRSKERDDHRREQEVIKGVRGGGRQIIWHCQRIKKMF